MQEILINLISFILSVTLGYFVYRFFKKKCSGGEKFKTEFLSPIETGTVFENIEIKIFQKTNEKVIKATIGYIGKPLVELTEYELETLYESLKDFYKKKGEEEK